MAYSRLLTYVIEHCSDSTTNTQRCTNAQAGVGFRSRNITLFSLATLASGFFMMKARTRSLAEHKKAAGDYSVTVDRSGMLPLGAVIPKMQQPWADKGFVGGGI